MKTLAFVIGLLLVAGAGWTQTQTTPQEAMKALKAAEKAYTEADLELQRADIRTQKRGIIDALTDFNSTQEKAFWAVYDNYEKELTKLNDQRLALIKDYAAQYMKLTDAQALDLTNRAFDFQEKRLALRKSYMESLKKILPGIQVGRLMQLENQLDMLIDLQIAAQVPLAD